MYVAVYDGGDSNRLGNVAAKKKSAKKAAPKKAAAKKPPAERASIVASSDDDVQSGVIEVIAEQCGVKPSGIGAKPLSKLTATCDDVFRGGIASALNGKFGHLNPRMSSSDVACSDTADSLTRTVTDRLG